MIRAFPSQRAAWPTLLLLLCVWLTAAVGHAAEGMEDGKPVVNAQAVRRIALIVGANDGGKERVKLQYAGSDASTVAKVLGELGGLKQGDRTVMEDPTHDALLWAIGKIAEKVRKAKNAGSSVQFIFYYSGHSDERGLLLGEARMEYRSLRKAIDKVPADVRVAILDSCASGAFTRLKGGTKRAPFIVSGATDVKGHAYLTSSSADEAAQESDRVGGSFFTHYLTTGLRGAADADGDRVITLSEAYEFAFDETLARTEATRGGAQHAAYDINLSGTGDLVLTDLRRTTARLELTDEISGRVSVRRVGGELYAELYKPAGSGPVLLALEPGRYQVTVDDGTNLYRAEKTVGRQRAVLMRADLKKISREATVQRGDDDEDGDEEDDDPEYVHVPFNIGLVPALSINGKTRRKRKGKKIRNAFSMGILWSRTDKIDGVAMAFGPTFVNDHVDGAQLSVFANVSKGLVEGAQVSQGANIAGELNGAQLTMLYNGARRVRGWQASVGVNHAKAIRGSQLGLINTAGRMKGAQVGLINFAKSADAQLGLISATREHGVHPEVWTSDTATYNVGIRMPAKYTYSGLFVGLHPSGENRGWIFGGMFGGHLKLPARMFLDIDLLAAAAGNSLQVKPPFGLLTKLRVTVGWQPFDRLALFGGPTLGLMFDMFGDEDQATNRPGYEWGGAEFVKNRVRLRILPGFAAGLRF